MDWYYLHILADFRQTLHYLWRMGKRLWRGQEEDFGWGIQRTAL
jgi:hypothetical protein